MIPRGIYYKKYVTQTFCTLVQIKKGAGYARMASILVGGNGHHKHHGKSSGILCR